MIALCPVHALSVAQRLTSTDPEDIAQEALLWMILTPAYQTASGYWYGARKAIRQRYRRTHTLLGGKRAGGQRVPVLEFDDSLFSNGMKEDHFLELLDAVTGRSQPLVRSRVVMPTQGYTCRHCGDTFQAARPAKYCPTSKSYCRENARRARRAA